MINFNFPIFENLYFTHTMRKNPLYTLKTMCKYVLYAYYEKSLNVQKTPCNYNYKKMNAKKNHF